MGYYQFNGTAVNDTVVAQDGDDFYMYGKGGNDDLTGGGSSSQYGMLNGGQGDDHLFATAGTLYAYGGEGDDYVGGKADYLYLYGGDGNDGFGPNAAIHGEVYGEAGDDMFYVVAPHTPGTLFLYGGEGDDVMIGNKGLVMDPGPGSDHIFVSAAGGDRYVFGKGDGADVLEYLNRPEPQMASAGKVLEELHFKPGVSPDEVWVQYDETGVSLEIIVGLAGADRILLDTGATGFDAIGAPYSINRITFSDAPSIVWSKSDLLSRRAPLPIGSDVSQRLIGTKRNDTVDGRAGDDSIYGLDGNDVLSGGLGNDLLDGGSGNDSLTGDAGADTLFGGVGADTLSGGSENDSLDGGADNDLLLGGAGSDTLNGIAGVDTMIGGAGFDVYHVDNSADVIIEEANSDMDQVYASASYVLSANTEYGELTGSANINLTGNDSGVQLWGNAGSNLITGGKGDDELSGGFGGVDTLAGGAGDDVYMVLNKTDVLVEKANEGFDEAWAMVSGYKLPANVEALKLLSNMTSGYGNDATNSVSGNGAANAIYGMGGDDFMMGYGGNDTLTGGLGNDTLSGGAGNDVYIYSAGDGEDEISNYDSKGVDTLLIHGATESQIWFESYGKDLYISIVGREGGVGITKWNVGSAYQVDLIKLDNGKTLSAGSVANLVNAMSSFTPPAIGQTSLPANYQAALGATIAQNWVA